MFCLSRQPETAILHSNKSISQSPFFPLRNRSRGFDGEIGTSCRLVVTSTRPIVDSAFLTGPVHLTGFSCSNRHSSTIPALMNVSWTFQMTQRHGAF
ncbi:Uncharacterized protein APZ42_016128 [Daphnia magna]|uniref:Uncharacterized protein n=1 Tax=Daphnia magna TaxID=35525 RepID=A0A162NN06_9CRUS|nr:Uncharacterized protein APZ42_016128 [Daphnia magna]